MVRAEVLHKNKKRDSIAFLVTGGGFFKIYSYFYIYIFKGHYTVNIHADHACEKVGKALRKAVHNFWNPVKVF